MDTDYDTSDFKLRRLLKSKRQGMRLVNKKVTDTDDDDRGTSSSSGGASGGAVRQQDTTPPDRWTIGKKTGTYLLDDTVSMDRKRRLIEQTGHRHLAKVNAREHAEAANEASQDSTLEGELQNSILQHPLLATQRFDGIDPNVNPEPPLNTEARREFDNERREQEKEKQLRLGLSLDNAPKFSSTLKPRPP